jgi:hypothetical protein
VEKTKTNKKRKRREVNQSATLGRFKEQSQGPPPPTSTNRRRAGQKSSIFLLHIFNFSVDLLLLPFRWFFWQLPFRQCCLLTPACGKAKQRDTTLLKGACTGFACDFLSLCASPNCHFAGIIAAEQPICESCPPVTRHSASIVNSLDARRIASG